MGVPAVVRIQANTKLWNPQLSPNNCEKLKNCDSNRSYTGGDFSVSSLREEHYAIPNRRLLEYPMKLLELELCHEIQKSLPPPRASKLPVHVSLGGNQLEMGIKLRDILTSFSA